MFRKRWRFFATYVLPYLIISSFIYRHCTKAPQRTLAETTQLETYRSWAGRMKKTTERFQTIARGEPELLSEKIELEILPELESLNRDMEGHTHTTLELQPLFAEVHGVVEGFIDYARTLAKGSGLDAPTPELMEKHALFLEKVTKWQNLQTEVKKKLKF